MTRWAATGVVLLIATAVCAQEPPVSHQESVRLRVKALVIAIVPVGSFKGEIIPTDFQPSFALTVRIQSVEPEADAFVPGKRVTFGIHSQSLLFNGDAKKDRSYTFCLRRDTINDATRYSHLSLSKPGGRCRDESR